MRNGIAEISDLKERVRCCPFTKNVFEYVERGSICEREGLIHLSYALSHALEKSLKDHSNTIANNGNPELSIFGNLSTACSWAPYVASSFEPIPLAPFDPSNPIAPEATEEHF